MGVGHNECDDATPTIGLRVFSVSSYLAVDKLRIAKTSMSYDLENNLIGPIALISIRTNITTGDTDV